MAVLLSLVLVFAQTRGKCTLGRKEYVRWIRGLDQTFLSGKRSRNAYQGKIKKWLHKGRRASITRLRLRVCLRSQLVRRPASGRGGVEAIDREGGTERGAARAERRKRIETQARRGLSQKLVGGTRAGPRRAFGELRRRRSRRRSLSKGVA